MLDNLIEQYKKINPEGELTSCFLMCDFKELNNTKWQFNFLKDNKITIHTINKIEEDQEIHNGENIETLNIKKVKIKPSKAVEEAKKQIKIGEPNKIIIIIQNKVPIYNITFLTNAMKLINVKLLASDNTILETKEENLLNLQSQ